MENNLDFNTYLISKKIDPGKFRTGEGQLYEKLASFFEEAHPNSFTAQKLFLINPIRRKYLLEEQVEVVPSKVKMKLKPKMK